MRDEFSRGVEGVFGGAEVEACLFFLWGGFRFFSFGFLGMGMVEGWDEGEGGGLVRCSLVMILLLAFFFGWEKGLCFPLEFRRKGIRRCLLL